MTDATQRSPRVGAQATGSPATASLGGMAAPMRRNRTRRKVLPEHARGHNRSLVLQTLFHDGAMSRADLSRETGLTRVTISDLVAELIADTLVEEQGIRETSKPGKPAILVDIARGSHRIVGLDLSEPGHFRGAVLTVDGDVVERREVPHGADAAANVAAVIDLAKALMEASALPVLGIGIGSPGVVRTDGVVLTAPNLGWVDVALRAAVEAVVDVPVVVANDANAAVLAEHTLGGADDDTILVRIGLGVGSALLSGGEPMIGSRFAAGEIGHVTVGTDGGPACVCGKVGCLEAWLSLPALERRIAETGDREAVLRDAGERLAIALAPIVGALDLSEIILSGPADHLDGVLAETAVETLRARTLAPFTAGVRVRMTEQGDDIVLRGAAVMVLSSQLGVS